MTEAQKYDLSSFSLHQINKMFSSDMTTAMVEERFASHNEFCHA